MQIKIIYFASLRDDSQKGDEVIETTSQTVEELYHELNSKYNFGVPRDHLKAALNEEYVSFNQSLTNNDTVVFIPPVAGG